VLVHGGQSRAILTVDGLMDERRVTIKSVGRLLRRSCAFIAGATVLADGAIAFLLDPASLVSAVERRAWSERLDASPVPIAPRSARILVVDDMATTRELERSILKAAGYDVEVAADGGQALERLREAAFDLVVTDIEMPVMDGMALVAAIRRQRRLSHLPVILVTSLASDKAEQRGREVGAQAYIEKTQFTQDVLLDTIERLVNGRR
jgi:two-component system chemotaxis sensor kinase CheA